MIFRALGLFGLALAFSIGQAFAQEQSDFDLDGISDYTHLSSSGSTLIWNKAFSGGAPNESVSFGLISDRPIMGRWLGPEVPSLAVIRLDQKSSALNWKVLLDSGLLAEEAFGKAGSLYLAGADFDGNGISDPAIVERGKRGLKWTVRLNMFAPEGQKTLKFRHGIVGDRAFFLSPDGISDWAGAFGRDKKGKVRILLKNLRVKEKRTIRKIDKRLTRGDRPRPFPVKAADGTDAIAFLTDSGGDSVLWIYDLNGSLIRKVTFPGSGSFGIGNFNAAEAGEEILLQANGAVNLYNPFSGVNLKPTPAGGPPQDEISVDTVTAPTPIPTATSQATNTPVNTPTFTPTATNTPG